MDYNFTTSNTRDFEHLIQALAQSLLGKNSIVFGDGPDGARELTYRGKANFPNESETWDGYWIIQAKYKSRNFDKDDDFEWIKKNFISEMDKFKDEKRNLEKPTNYLFFTNAILTPVQNTGGRDKIEQLKLTYINLIPNIYIASYDELCKHLDNNRDVATTNSSFILCGDILAKLFDLLDYEEKRKKETQNTILTYLEKSFNAELYSKLIQAGDLTNEVNIEKVFIDLDVSKVHQPNERIKFLNKLIDLGNYKSMPNSPTKLVLVGGAGSGKSTLSQFASQTYSAFFVSDNRRTLANDKIRNFISEFKICDKPKCLRFPFKIILKDFAAWIKEQKDIRQSHSVLHYIKYRIETIGDGRIETETLREFFSKISLLFIFDGLDEVPVTSNRDDVLKEINDFIDIELKNQNSDAIILCTTRQQGYTKDFDENTFQHFYVSELSDEDCINYLEKLLNNIERSQDNRQSYLNTLKDAIKDNVAGRLMRTPLQATIMTILVKSGGKPSRNKYNLFKEYYETIYKRELQKELLHILKDYKRNIDDIHALLAFELQANSEGTDNPSALIDIQDFQNLIRLSLKKREEWEDKDIDSFIVKIEKAIIDRLVFIGEIQDKKIGFVVRPLQEYFASNFIINFPEDIVIKNINNISNSSYWRNTFLFAVSGLHNTKNHLIDNVYSLCLRLNGNEEVINTPTLYNSIYYGSWLSLEILSEGIFSDSPKNKNRFARLIEKLFSSINTGDLNKIQYLPNDIVIDLVIQKYIKEILYSEKSYKEKYASFRLSFLLLINSNFYSQINEILSKAWNDEYEFDLIHLMVDVNITHTLFFINKVSNALVKDGYFKYIDLFELDFFNEFKIPKSLIKHNRNDRILIGRIIEISFLLSLKQPAYRRHGKDGIFSLFNEILKIEMDKQKEIIFFTDREIEIVKGYSVSIGLIKSETINLDYLHGLFKNYSLTYLCSYVDFIKTPSVKNLSQIFIDLKTLNNNTIYKAILNSSTVWLLREISDKFKDISEISNLIESTQNNDFGDISDWLALENKMINKQELEYVFKYGYMRHWQNRAEILNNFYNEYHKNYLENSSIIQFELIRIFPWYQDSMLREKGVVSISEHLLEIILKIFNSIDVTTLKEYQVRLLKDAIIAYLYNIEVNRIDQVNEKLFRIFDYNNNIYYRNSKSITLKVFEKCVAYHNHCIFINKSSDMEQLIVFLLSGFNEYSIDQVKLINFKSKEINDSDSISNLVLRLITTQINLENITFIVSKFNEYSNPNKLYNTISRIFLNLKINEPLNIEFFIKSYHLLIRRNDISIDTIANIEEYLKFVIESRMTNMKELQLTNSMRN